MTLYKARLMTTHVDKHGDKFTLSALESAKEQIESNIIPQGIEHDPRIEPIGRIISAEITKLEDGEYALDATSELFNDMSTIREINDRELVIHNYPHDSIVIRTDQNYRNTEDQKLVNEISEILECKIPPEEEIKKSLEPLSVLWICGAFILGGISSGFLGKLGSDIYDLFKRKLTALVTKRKEGEKEKLLAFDFQITDQQCNVELIITNPTSEDVKYVLENGIQQLDQILPRYFKLESEKPIKKLVFEVENNELVFKFGVRNDGIPIRIIKEDN